MTAEMTTSTISVSVREARLVTDRLLLTLGIPSGYVFAVRECILVSQGCGLGGFVRLADDRATLATPFLNTLAVSGDLNDIDGDAGGVHAWIALPAVVDLAIAGARKFGTAQLILKNVRAPSEVACATHLAARHGVHIDITLASDGCVGDVILAARNTWRPRTLEDGYPLLADALATGFKVERELWQSLYHFSNGALARDSVQSRRHAGPVIVLDDGTVVGRMPVDDDFDPAILLSVNQDEKGPVDEQ